MNKQVTRILAGFLFLVFLAGIMPKEYIHDAFFDHDDAVHPVYKKGELVITKKHHHCSFLSFEFAPFIVPSVHVITFRQPVVHAGYVHSYYFFCYSNPFNVAIPRGPPSAGVEAVSTIS